MSLEVRLAHRRGRQGYRTGRIAAQPTQARGPAVPGRRARGAERSEPLGDLIVQLLILSRLIKRDLDTLPQRLQDRVLDGRVSLRALRWVTIED